MIRLTCLLLLLLVPASSGEERFARRTSVNLTREGERWAERTLKKLTLEQKLGQLFMVRAQAEFLNLESPEYLRLKQMLERYHVGAFLLTARAEGALIHRGQPFEAAMLTNQLQRDSALPLLFAADFERGLHMRLHGTTAFPHAMAFGATGKPELAFQFGRIVAEEARAIGVHWNFFPVADVNHNPRNPIINARSFGEDPEQVAQLVAAYIRGAREAGMLTTVKHFPGQGDTEHDTHLVATTLRADLAYLEAVDLRPFRLAIAAGVDAVMVAHVVAPELDPAPGRVASLSPPVIEGVLRDQLKFAGLVVPDGMDMRAVTANYPNGTGGRASVDAILAGNDMIILPADLPAAYDALLKAVTDGEIPEGRIDRSVLKILRAKASVGLHKANLVDIDNVSRSVARPSSLSFAQQVADAATTLVLDNGSVLPLQSPGTPAPPDAYPSAGARARVLAVVFSDDLRAESGRQFERELRRRDPQAQVIALDPGSAAAVAPRVLAAIEAADVVIAAVYSLPTAAKKVQVEGVNTNSIALDDSSAALLGRVLDRAAARTVVVSLGSPYLAQAFPRIQNYLCTYSNVPASESSAVRALYGEVAVRGRLPVTIPGVARRGYGLDLLPVTVAQGASHVSP